MNKKRLPIGIQTFSEIRTEGYYYADKTGFCLKLATQGKYYFLSRPRRFGKSLLIDTIGELFAGIKSCLKGYILMISVTGLFNIQLFGLVLVGASLKAVRI